MIYKIIILVTTFCAANIGGEENPSFRLDYTFSEQADGWLKFHRIPSKWNDAMIRCHAEGAILASPLTIELQKAIADFVSKEQDTEIYTGVHATYSEGDFASVEGVPLSKLPITWAADRPRGNSRNCLAMNTRGGTIKDKRCSDDLPYVCYKKRVKLSLTECGTSDIAYQLDARTGHCYKFHRRGQAWSTAYLTCAAEGGYLAIINSDQEDDVLRELYATVKREDIVSRNPETCHIGFRDLRGDGSWMTVHGKTPTQAGFNRWAKGQPDNATNGGDEGETCGSIFRNGLLNDVWCGWASPFICEKTPNSLVSLDIDYKK